MIFLEQSLEKIDFFCASKKNFDRLAGGCPEEYFGKKISKKSSSVRKFLMDFTKKISTGLSNFHFKSLEDSSERMFFPEFSRLMHPE